MALSLGENLSGKMIILLRKISVPAPIGLGVMTIVAWCVFFAATTSVCNSQEKSDVSPVAARYIDTFCEVGGSMIMQVKTGSTELSLAVDLGVNVVVIRPESASSLNSIGKATAVISGKTVVADRYGELTYSIAPGDASFVAQTVSHPLEDSSSFIPDKTDGLLGTNFLKFHPLYVSNSEAFFALVERTNKFEFLQHQASINLSDNGVLTVESSLLGAEMDFHIDNGFSGSIGLQSDMFNSLAETTENVIKESTISTLAGNVKVRTFSVKTLSFLGLAFSDVEIHETQMPIVGIGILGAIDFVLDLDRGVMRFALARRNQKWQKGPPIN